MDDNKVNDIDFEKIQKALESKIQEQEEVEEEALEKAIPTRVRLEEPDEVPDGMIKVDMEDLPVIWEWTEEKTSESQSKSGQTSQMEGQKSSQPESRKSSQSENKKTSRQEKQQKKQQKKQQEKQQKKQQDKKQQAKQQSEQQDKQQSEQQDKQQAKQPKQQLERQPWEIQDWEPEAEPDSTEKKRKSWNPRTLLGNLSDTFKKSGKNVNPHGENIEDFDDFDEEDHTEEESQVEFILEQEKTNQEEQQWQIEETWMPGKPKTSDEEDSVREDTAATIITEGPDEKLPAASKLRRRDKNVHSAVTKTQESPRRGKASEKKSKHMISPDPEATEKKVSSLSDYRERILAYRKKKWIRIAAMAVGVLIVLIIISNVVKYWSYHSYSVSSKADGTDTIAASYENINGNILKYSLDSAELMNKSGKKLWSSSYSMNAPEVASCQDTIAVYDTQGTAIRIFKKSGESGNITTKYPIVKACVAEQGVIAAILNSGDNTTIEYYTQNGQVIASFRTTIDNPGYPMDISLSNDGMLLGVSYLYVVDGKPSTRIVFYNFSSSGQNQTDNVVNSQEMTGSVTPDVTYLDADTCLAIRDDGFTVYEGKQIPKEDTSVTIDQEILSAAYDDSSVVLITRDDTGEHAYKMTEYNLKGRVIFEKGFDFAYTSVSIEANQILMYNRQNICVFSKAGVCKYQGEAGTSVLGQVLALGATRYMVVTEEGTSTIKLK